MGCFHCKPQTRILHVHIYVNKNIHKQLDHVYIYNWVAGLGYLAKSQTTCEPLSLTPSIYLFSNPCVSEHEHELVIPCIPAMTSLYACTINDNYFFISFRNNYLLSCSKTGKSRKKNVYGSAVILASVT